MINTSSSFHLLHDKVKQWVWRQDWNSLKEIQENSIPVILSQKCDVIISAATAGGKTEAAFLPILTSILQEKISSGYQVLYISPLKALINDQYRRLSEMTLNMGVDVIPWHGDIDTIRKNKSLKDPRGILIITPESLESFFINKSSYIESAFSDLKYVVIDEFHSFVGNERGRQLQSLLSRLEHMTQKHTPRVAMSATFSDYDVVKNLIRNDGTMPCVIPTQGVNNHETKLLIKSFLQTKDNNVKEVIANELFYKLRGHSNLVFVNTKNEAEEYAVMLSELSFHKNYPNEFRVHHGSLSKIEREEVEADLQKGLQPITAVCTSTMELGVDIGKVKSISQIRVAASVSGLRQRLGRSGRRNEPSILRIFSIDDFRTGILFDLKVNLIQNIAVIELLKERKYEVPNVNSYHFSTLIQQLLSAIAQFGGFYPKEGWQLLCLEGAFRNITPTMYLKILRLLVKNGLVIQLTNGQITIGDEGERLLKKSDFYCAFQTINDYDVIDESKYKILGVVQYLFPINTQFILAGRCWRVNNVDKIKKKIYVTPGRIGGSAFFGGDGIEIDEIITNKMREIYISNESYFYLDLETGAGKFLEQARSFFKTNNLLSQSFLDNGEQINFFTWAGSKVNRTISLIAKLYLYKNCTFNALFISNITSTDVEKIIKNPKPLGEELSKLELRTVKERQKYDYLLSDELLDIEYSKAYLDVDKSWELLKNCLI
jgi:ATP-dependent Lhr-like helicase